MERLILDPTELATGRTELDITPWIDVEGIDWGETQMEAYKAEAEIGESVLDYRLPNRLITVPLVIREQGGTTFANARSSIQAKAARYIQEGGIGKRILASGGTVYFDIVANGLSLGGDWLQANRNVDTEAELQLEAIPDFYEPEELVAEAEEKSATELIKVIPDPGGDMPARVRIVVEEKQGADQKGLIWAFRSRHYSTAVTAETEYEAEQLMTLNASRKLALTGASGGTVVQHGTVATSWTPIVVGRIGGTAFPTHTGTNRVFARVYSTSGTLVSARLVWDVGDLINPVENAEYRVPGASNFYIADLGEVRLDPPPIGTHRWDWQIQARGDVGEEDFKVDKVWIVNADERMGVCTSPVSTQQSVVPFSARDEFNQSAGTLTGKTAAVGGTYALAGDVVGFVVNATTHVAERSEISDASGVGTYAILSGGEYTNIALTVGVEVSLAEGANGEQYGGIVRYTDTENHVKLVVRRLSTGLYDVSWTIELVKKKEGTSTTVASYSPASMQKMSRFGPGPTATPVAWITASGEWYLGVDGTYIKSGTDADLGASGKLKTGKVGLYDGNVSSTTKTRTYDNLQAWAPIPDAVLFASQKAQLTTEGMFRLDSGGSAYGPVSRVIGDLPRLPAGGLEGRSTELFLKASRGDMGELPDSAIDDLGVKVYAARSRLMVPESG